MNVAAAAERTSKPKASKIGRPTREDSARRRQELLDAAAGLFLEVGYDAVTMEQIAAVIGMAKKTIYTWHQDKAALFRATVQYTIDRMIETQAETLRSVELADLPTALTHVARMRLDQVTSPVGIRLQRIVNAEARRFPDIVEAASEQVTRPVVTTLAAILRRCPNLNDTVASNPELAAAMFLSMAAGAPSRTIAAGGGVHESELEARISMSVDLFVRGVGIGQP